MTGRAFVCGIITCPRVRAPESNGHLTFTHHLMHTYTNLVTPYATSNLISPDAAHCAHALPRYVLAFSIWKARLVITRTR
jgi:hypothetical protein